MTMETNSLTQEQEVVPRILAGQAVRYLCVPFDKDALSLTASQQLVWAYVYDVAHGPQSGVRRLTQSSWIRMMDNELLASFELEAWNTESRRRLLQAWIKSRLAWEAPDGAILLQPSVRYAKIPYIIAFHPGITSVLKIAWCQLQLIAANRPTLPICGLTHRRGTKDNPAIKRSMIIKIKKLINLGLIEFNNDRLTLVPLIRFIEGHERLLLADIGDIKPGLMFLHMDKRFMIVMNEFIKIITEEGRAIRDAHMKLGEQYDKLKLRNGRGVTVKELNSLRNEVAHSEMILAKRLHAALSGAECERNVCMLGFNSGTFDVIAPASQFPHPVGLIDLHMAASGQLRMKWVDDGRRMIRSLIHGGYP